MISPPPANEAKLIKASEQVAGLYHDERRAPASAQIALGINRVAQLGGTAADIFATLAAVLAFDQDNPRYFRDTRHRNHTIALHVLAIGGGRRLGRGSNYKTPPVKVRDGLAQLLLEGPGAMAGRVAAEAHRRTAAARPDWFAHLRGPDGKVAGIDKPFSPEVIAEARGEALDAEVAGE